MSNPASERRRLARQNDPLSYAAIKIDTLKRALFQANDLGSDAMLRTEGSCVCEVCGDAHRDHAAVPSAEYLRGLCSGLRVKL